MGGSDSDEAEELEKPGSVAADSCSTLDSAAKLSSAETSIGGATPTEPASTHEPDITESRLSIYDFVE